MSCLTLRASMKAGLLAGMRIEPLNRLLRVSVALRDKVYVTSQEIFMSVMDGRCLGSLQSSMFSSWTLIVNLLFMKLFVSLDISLCVILLQPFYNNKLVTAQFLPIIFDAHI